MLQPSSRSPGCDRYRGRLVSRISKVARSFPSGYNAAMASAKISCFETASNSVMHARNFMSSGEPRISVTRFSLAAMTRRVHSSNRTRGHRGELRAIQYQANGKTLLNLINEDLAAAGLPPFLPWTASKIGAFNLLDDLDHESEIRLLFKHHEGAPDERQNDG